MAEELEVLKYKNIWNKETHTRSTIRLLGFHFVWFFLHRISLGIINRTLIILFCKLPDMPDMGDANIGCDVKKSISSAPIMLQLFHQKQPGFVWSLAFNLY